MNKLNSVSSALLIKLSYLVTNVWGFSRKEIVTHKLTIAV
jgi:hypothetical protein